MPIQEYTPGRVYAPRYVRFYLEDLILLEGFTIDEYEFETPDHAYVSFWRVRSKDPSIKPQRYPVLLLHGLLDCSASWFLQSDK